MIDMLEVVCFGGYDLVVDAMGKSVAVINLLIV